MRQRAKVVPDASGVVLDLGVGTGLNLLATWEAWRQADAPGRLRFTSFEAFPMTLADMETALRAFPQVEALARALLDALGGVGPVFDLGDAELTLITGDARQALPVWDGRADAWFLDGFSPAKNPELWGEALMAEVGRHTAPAGTAATYTAAGHVRRGLEAAGFTVDRVPGVGRKRHMTRAVLA